MGRIGIGRIQTGNPAQIESAIQEVATEVGNNLQTGSSAPNGSTPGKVYFEHGATDSNGWATVTTVYINTKR